MTDNEIIKDMETCIKYREERECGNCSRIGRYQCAVTLMQDAFGIIKRQNAEIERLQEMLDSAVSSERNAVESVLERQIEKVEKENQNETV